MTAKQDRPTQFDIEHPLLGLDDPRLDPPAYDPADNMGDPVLEDEYSDDPQVGDVGATTTHCPMCGTPVMVSYTVLAEEPCPEHPGEVHKMVEVDQQPIIDHVEHCRIYDLLDAIFPDVRQEDSGPKQCTDCGGSGFASSWDGVESAVCTKCDGWGHDTPEATPS